MTVVMCVTEELQVTAQLVGVMPSKHPGVLPTAPLVRLGILLIFNFVNQKNGLSARRDSINSNLVFSSNSMYMALEALDAIYLGFC